MGSSRSTEMVQEASHLPCYVCKPISQPLFHFKLQKSNSKSTWTGALFPWHTHVGGPSRCLPAATFLYRSEKVIIQNLGFWTPWLGVEIQAVYCLAEVLV